MSPELILLSFNTPQKRLPFHPRLHRNKKINQKENYIKYLGVNLGSDLCRRYHIHQNLMSKLWA